MKKTLGTIIATAVLTCTAQAVEPTYTLSWEDGAAITTAPTDAVTTWDSFAGSFTTAEGQDYATFGNNVAPKIGTNLTGIGEDFTISFDWKAGADATASPWKTLLGIGSMHVTNKSDHTLQFQYTNADDGLSFRLYNMGGTYGNESADGGPSDTLLVTYTVNFSEVTDWVNFQIVSDVTNSMLSLYVDGKLVDSYEEWGTKTRPAKDNFSPTGISFGSAVGGDRPFDADVNINNIAIYNAAIPEPATATLSLLALAGLAARRRRK